MTTATLVAGQQLQNRYTIVRQLGSGGMGVVYLAHDGRLGSKVALKELSLDALPPAERPEALQSFQIEAQLLAQLDHPGLTKVTDFFSEQGRWCLVMEYVDGDTLAALAQRQRGRVTEAEARSWTLQLCEVLAYLHNQQPPVIFRDLKPDNIMRTVDGRIKLIDFGIARFFKPGQTRDTRHMGTPGFAAPEQYGRGQTDARSDIYSLGATLHHLLTGYDPAQTPFALPSVQSLNPSISSSFEQTIQRAVQPHPDQRYGSVAELRAALETAAPQPPPVAPPPVIEPTASRPTVQRADLLAVGSVTALLSCSLVVLPGQLLPWLTATLPPQWAIPLAGDSYLLETSVTVVAGFILLVLVLAYYLTHQPGSVLLTALIAGLFNPDWLLPLLTIAGTLEVVFGLSVWRTRNVWIVSAAGIVSALLAGYFWQAPITDNVALVSGAAGGVLLAALIGSVYGQLTGIGYATPAPRLGTKSMTSSKRAGVVKYVLVVVGCGLVGLLLPWWAQHFAAEPLRQVLESWQLPERWWLFFWSALLACLTVLPLLLAYFATHRPGAVLLATLAGSIPVLLWLRSLGLDLTPALFVVTFFGARDLRVLLLCGLSIELIFLLTAWRTHHILVALLAGIVATSGAFFWLQSSLTWPPRWEQIAPLAVGAGLAGLLAAPAGAAFNRLWPQ